MAKSIEHKTEGDSSAEVLRRLLHLVRFMSSKKECSLEDIMSKVYKSDLEDKAAYKRFRRDIDRVKYLFCEEKMMPEDYEENCDEDDRDNYQIQIECKEKKKYVLINQTSLLPLMLKNEDIEVLVSGLKLSAHFLPQYEKAANNVRAQIDRYLDAEKKNFADNLGDAITVAMPVGKVDTDIFKKIIDAIQKKKMLLIGEYRTFNGKMAVKHFSPWIVYFRYHTWYAWGVTEEDYEINQFSGPLRISRMNNVSNYEDMSYREPNDNYGNLMTNLVKKDCNPNDQYVLFDIVLRIFPSFAEAAKDIEWYPGGYFEPDPKNKGAVIYKVQLKGLDDITRWMMRAIECFEIIEPKELREKVNNKINGYLSRNTVENEN